MIKEAIELGHVIDAHKVGKGVDVDHKVDPAAMGWSDYEYTVNGKKYTYSVTGYSGANAPSHIQLYWINNPAKAFHEKDKSAKFSFFLLLLVIALGMMSNFISKSLLH